jgi:hypothetical protein
MVVSAGTRWRLSPLTNLQEARSRGFPLRVDLDNNTKTLLITSSSQSVDSEHLALMLRSYQVPLGWKSRCRGRDTGRSPRRVADKVTRTCIFTLYGKVFLH